LLLKRILFGLMPPKGPGRIFSYQLCSSSHVMLQK
jgi:hypothetical protein